MNCATVQNMIAQLKKIDMTSIFKKVSLYISVIKNSNYATVQNSFAQLKGLIYRSIFINCATVQNSFAQVTVQSAMHIYIIYALHCTVVKGEMC